MFSVLSFIITSGRSTSRPTFADMFYWRNRSCLPAYQALSDLEFTQKDNELVLSWTVAVRYIPVFKKQFKTVVKIAEWLNLKFPRQNKLKTEFFVGCRYFSPTGRYNLSDSFQSISRA